MSDKTRQDTSLANTALLVSEGNHRSSLWLELQRFGSAEREQQINLFVEEYSDSQANKTTMTGLNLTVRQDRALTAIQKLLEKTNYQGNLKQKQINSQAFFWNGYLPALHSSYPEYFEAYGFPKKIDAKQKKEALAALWSLTEPYVIIYERKRFEGKKQTTDTIQTFKQLLQVTKVRKGLTDKELEAIRNGDQATIERTTSLVIEISPLLLDGINENFYVLVPNNLHKSISEILQKKRYSPAVLLFIRWLNTLNKIEWKIKLEPLAEKLRVDGYLKSRKKKKLKSLLEDEVFSVALKLDFLSQWEEYATDRYKFILNADRCSRINKALLEGKPAIT